MQLRATITFESQADSVLLSQNFSPENQKRLSIVENNLHTPEKGCTSIRLRDGQLHQLVHEQQLQENEKLRVRFPYCGQWVILCIEHLAMQPQETKEPSSRW